MGQVNNLKNKIGFGSTEYIVHRSNGKIINEWLFLLYSNSRIRKKLASTMSGAVGHKRISKDTIENLQISSPTIKEQKKITNKLFEIKKTIDSKISTIDKETINYNLLKKSILNKEFSYE
jgi:type I restriction enzyme S subunit